MASEEGNLDSIKKIELRRKCLKQSMKQFKSLLQEVEHNYSKILEENIKLREKLLEFESKTTDILKTDSDILYPSFTKKMGALFDGASTKLRINRNKSLKGVNLVHRENYIQAHSDCVVDLTCINNYIASSSYDKTCKIWLTAADTCIAIYRGHNAAVNSCRLSPVDPFYACSASGDGSLHVWSFKYAQELYNNVKSDTISRSRVSTYCEEWLEKGDIEVGNDKIIFINKPLFTLESHQGIILHIVNLVILVLAAVSIADWTYDGKNIVSGSWDKSAVVWDVEKVKQITTFTGHDEEVLYVCCHNSSKLVLTSSADCNIRLWDMRTTKTPSVVICQAHNAEVNSALFTGSNIISGSSDKTSKLWDIRNFRDSIITLKTSSAITRLSINSDGHACLPMRNNHFRIWYHGPKPSKIFFSQINGHLKSIESSCWADVDNQKILYTSSIDGSIVKWKIQEPSLLKT